VAREVSRGEIWQFTFAPPDKRRPVLVLTRQDLIGRMREVTVAPITSKVRGIRSEVVVGPEVGLKATSAINLNHVATVPASLLQRYVGTVSPETMDTVRDALLFALGFAAPRR
jgi:mRNA interferase MazF